MVGFLLKYLTATPQIVLTTLRILGFEISQTLKNQQNETNIEKPTYLRKQLPGGVL